jgi:tetratricopeptide (TPR) repeat protein
MLADVYRAVGKGSEAAETISRALKISNERGERGFEAWAMLVMAGIKNAANRSEEAKNWYERALRQATELSMSPLIAHCHRGLSKSHLHIGNEKQAQLENETALEMYHSLGMTYWQSTG